MTEPAPALSDAPSSAELRPIDAPEDRLLEILGGRAQPLFALLDAARDYRVHALLAESGHEFQSLYEGAQGKELAEVAPYLVRLPAQSRLLEQLVRDGWGQSWGVYLTSEGSFKGIRKQFRHFLMVKTEDGKELYFRFYDPRVLRVFLPTCGSSEAAEFFGPIRRFWCEHQTPRVLLEFTLTEQGVVVEPSPLAEADDPALLTAAR